MVAVEAMSAGRAVIVSRIGGLKDTIADGENGLLVPPADASALAQAMQRLIDDPVFRERLGQAALKRASDYTANNVIPQFERLYLRLIQAAERQRKEKQLRVVDEEV